MGECLDWDYVNHYLTTLLISRSRLITQAGQPDHHLSPTERTDSTFNWGTLASLDVQPLLSTHTQNRLSWDFVSELKRTGKVRRDFCLPFQSLSELRLQKANERFPYPWKVKVKVVSDSLWLYSPWDSPGQNTGVGSLSLLQGIFPTQGSKPGLLHCRQILYQLSSQGRPSPLSLLFTFSAIQSPGFAGF